MNDIQTRRNLYSLAQMLRVHFEYLHGLHNSTVALFDVLRAKNPEIETFYKQHPLVQSQQMPGKDPDVMLRNLDALIRRLE